MTKLVLLLALLAVGCRDRADDDRRGYSKTSETADDDFAHTRKTYSDHINERLKRLDERIHELAARGTEKAREAADRLSIERDRLAPKVDEIGRHAKDGWDRFESEVSEGVDNLEKKLDAAIND
jgi:DNA-binding NtrC family response regulator